MFMDAKEMAKLMHVKRDTIYRWYKTWPDFPQPMTPYRPLIWRVSDFMEWIDNSERYYNKSRSD